MQKFKNEVRTLSDQMEEYSLRKEKIEQLKKELNVNPEWDIIEDEGEFYAVDMYNNHWLINVELRERLPSSYFHGPECDKDINGFDPFSGAIIYDLWKAGITEIKLSEGFYLDFLNAGDGICELLSSLKKDGFGSKVPPIHILPSGFINYQNDLQGSINGSGFDANIIKASIGEIGLRRLNLSEQISFYAILLEDTSNKSEDLKRTYKKILDDLKRVYTSLE